MRLLNDGKIMFFCDECERTAGAVVEFSDEGRAMRLCHECLRSALRLHDVYFPVDDD